MFDFNNERVLKAQKNGRIATLEEYLNDYNWNLLQGIYRKMERLEEYYTDEELQLMNYLFDDEM
jgi:hypothetical protein